MHKKMVHASLSAIIHNKSLMHLQVLSCSEEDKKWFMEAMQEQTLDVIKRMKEIAMIMNMPPEALEAQGVTTEDMEGKFLLLSFLLLLSFRLFSQEMSVCSAAGGAAGACGVN